MVGGKQGGEEEGALIKNCLKVTQRSNFGIEIHFDLVGICIHQERYTALHFGMGDCKWL